MDQRDATREQAEDWRQSAADPGVRDALRIRATFGTSDTQTTPWTDVRTLSWPDLCALLTRHEVGPKRGACIVPAVFRGGQRKMAYAERIEIVMLDSDAGATLAQIEAALRAHGWAAVVSSTHSHLGTQTVAKRDHWDKFRQAQGDRPDLA